jgi:hypothetical protein
MCSLRATCARSSTALGPSVIPGLQKREVGGYSFCFFSHSVDVFWEFGIWGKTLTSRTVEFVWLGAYDGVGSCRVGELGRDSCLGPLTFPNPSRPFSPNPPPLCSHPPPHSPHLWLPPPPSHLLFFQTLEATHQTLAAPHLLLPRCFSLPLGSTSCGANLRLFSVEGRREEGKGENPR